jgi:polysaccharide transporter, PST family
VSQDQADAPAEVGRKGLLVNGLALYAVQIVSLLIPFALLPVLTRRLTPETWGQVATVQALATILGMTIEFGFAYSAARQVALARGDREVIGLVVASVRASKQVLTVVLLVVCGAVAAFVVDSSEQWLLVASGVAFGVGQGWSWMWFFQGVERVSRAAVTELVARLAGAVVTVVLVTGSATAFVYLASIGCFSLAANAVNSRRARSYGAPARASARQVRKTLNEGFQNFTFRFVTSIYTTGSTAILSAISGPVQAAAYANADKLALAGKTMIAPASQVLYPRASRHAADDPRAARRFVTRNLVWLTGAFTAAALVGELVMGWFVPWFFGEPYREFVPVFRILLLTLPVVAATNVLAVHHLLAAGRVRLFNVFVVATVSINLLLVAVVVPRGGAEGMAWANLAAESALLVLLGVAFLRGRASD